MKNIALRLILLLSISLSGLSFTGKAFAATATETFTTAGTTSWTAPPGVTSVDVEAWGGGGAGGQRSTNGCGGGGGGGAYAKSTISVTPGNSYSYTVGSAGVNAGADGGDSSFNTSSVIAAGGKTVAANVATGGAGGLASGSTGTTRYDGGSGWTCSGAGGGGGSSAGTGTNGTTATSSTGATGPAGSGPGGNGRSGTQGNGSAPGSGPGGGGGGGYRTNSGTRTGGAGYAGQISLTYTKYTVLADGTDPTANGTVAPGTASNYLDQFTFDETTGTDSVTGLIVTTANTAAIASMQIWNEAMSTQYFGTVSSPTGNNWTFSGGTSISVTTTEAAYRVVFTAKDHTLASGTYAVTGTVTSFTSTNTASGTDTDSDTVTIDNTAPSGATVTSGVAGDAKVTLNWTTSASSDFNTTSGSVVYRWAAGSAGSEFPAEGSTPAAGDTNSTATVACVISSSGSTALSKIDGSGGSAGCTTANLTNGQAYTYKVFQKDNYGNYDAGVSIGTFTPAASGPPSCSSQASANWSAVGTWTAGCSGGNGQPIAGDIATISAGNTVTVDGAQAALQVTINNTGTLSFGASSSLTIGAITGTALTNNGTLTAGSSSTVIFSGATAPTALLSGSFTGSNAFYDLTLSPTIAGAVGYSAGAAFTVNHNLTLDPTSSGSNTLTLTLSGTTIVGGLTDLKGEVSGLSALDTGGQALTTGTLNIEAAGTLTANGSTITINGTSGPLFTRTGTFNANTSIVNFSETSADVALTNGTVTFNTLQINMSGRTGSLGAAITVNADLTVNAGTLADGGFQITGNGTGTLSASSGTALTLGSSGSGTSFPLSFTNAHITLNLSSTVTYSSAQTQTISGVPTYGNLTLSGASTKTLGAATTVAGTLTLSAGTLSVGGSSYALYVAGDWTNNGATFSGNSGTVYLNGGNSTTQTVSGSTTFASLNINTSGNSTGRAVHFVHGTTQTITDTWTVAGASGKVITLDYDNTSNWTVTPTAASVDYATVGHSTNTVGTICATHSSDGTGNSGWKFSTGTSCNVAPGIPSLDLPGNGATSQSTTPTFKTTATDTDGDYLDYQIKICEDSGMNTNCQTITQLSSQTGWSGQNANGGNAYNSATQATHVKQSALANSKTYYWETQAIDPAGTNTYGSYQASPYSFTTTSGGGNSAPSTPTLNVPTDAATNQSVNPVLKTTTTDPDGDTLKYKIILCTDQAMSQNCQTYDQSSSSIGWSAGSYSSGTQGAYTVQVPLGFSTVYYWDSYAIDPNGSNTWSGTQASPYSFRTQDAIMLKGISGKGITFD